MVFTLAHLSDLHLPLTRPPQLRLLLNKRALGWLSWSHRRSKEHRPEVLEALVADLRAEQPDHVVVTGDLTNLGLEEEFWTAAAWLQQLGGPQRVSVVPGNHDAYVPVPQSFWAYWAEYMTSDSPEYTRPLPPRTLTGKPEADFPTVRVRGPVALVGVCSAQPTGLFRATGRIGSQQLERIEQVLRTLADAALCRVVLLHHPPTDGGLSPRRRLIDASSFRAVLFRTGADLVLHGHIHKTALTTIPGPENPIPVVGVRSSSAIGRRPERQSRYHLYRLERQEDGRDACGFRITMVTRSYDATRGSFLRAGECTL
jgi:3',5'-cyclic AMP phosphodiesterase CpdA